MNAYPDFAKVAALIGDKTRAVILEALLDRTALPASELAYVARVSPQTISSHLAKLVEGGLLVMETHGRHRYYKLAGPEIAQVLESLALLAPPVQVRSLRQSMEMERVRLARTCYDHLAGRLGVLVTHALLDKGWMELREEAYLVTDLGAGELVRLGVDWRACQKSRRHFAKPCLDWSERRYHLAGALGAALTKRFVELEWVASDGKSRALHVTSRGEEMLYAEFGIEWAVAKG